MRSRSQRLFVVLIHMVGVSRHLPKFTSKRLTWNVGIVGVHPQHIYAEYLDLAALQPALSADAALAWNDAMLDAPFWLLDETDGKCLGPLGKFAECGDATLWRLRRGRRRGHGVTSDEIVYALQVVDTVERELSAYDASSSSINDQSEGDIPSWRKLNPAQIPFNILGNQEDYNLYERKQELLRQSGHSVHKGQECLMQTSSRSREDNGVFAGSGRLKLGPCTSARAWTWRISEEGVLRQDEGLAVLAQATSRGVWGAVSSLLWSSQASRFEYLGGGNGSKQNEVCVRRGLSPSGGLLNDAGLDSCWEHVQRGKSSSQHHLATSSLVSFSLAVYTAASTSPPPQKVGFVTKPEDSSQTPIRRKGSSFSPRESTSEEDAGPSGTNAASIDQPSMQKMQVVIDSPKVLGAEVQVIRNPDSAKSTLSKSKSSTRSTVMGSQVQGKHGKGPMSQGSSSLGVGSASTSLSYHAQPVHPLPTLSSLPPGTLSRQTRRLLKDSHPGLFSVKTSKNKIHMDAEDRKNTQTKPVGTTHWKIPKNPYIDASKNFIWTDPATGLEYPTDLCRYLGQEKKTSGRHTLVGVGQYMRTALKIKIYGAALYVSKRDVLSDPETFGPYAHMTADQLRKTPAFYDHLMTMHSVEGTGSGLGFDRTLLIKTNMQLSTETMRSSLKADWKLLSERQKDMLINTSMKARPAEAKMLEVIASKENTSNCSCGQIAPDEYKADPTCCARGTEVVFTWRKNDDLEVRLDGRLMDTFSEPNLAKGIFYEYIRGDDPISPDARDHFVDGFPFLLGPLLAQMKGSMAHHQPVTPTNEEVSGGKNGIQFFAFVTGLAETAQKSASSMINMVHGGAAGTLRASLGATKAIGQQMKEFGEEINRKSDEMGEHLTTMTLDSIDFLAQRTPFLPQELRRRIRNRRFYRSRGVRIFSKQNKMPIFAPSLRGGSSQLYQMQLESSPYLGDELGMAVDIEMDFKHRFFSTTVHLYLLLLLIVSLPGTHSTRLIIQSAKDAATKHRERRRAKSAKSIAKGNMPAGTFIAAAMTLTSSAVSALRPRSQVQPATVQNVPPQVAKVSERVNNKRTTLKRNRSRGSLVLIRRTDSYCFTIPEDEEVEPGPFAYSTGRPTLRKTVSYTF